MKGENTITVCQAQMIEIVQEWLKYKFNGAAVTKVESTSTYGSQSFNITLSEKKDDDD